MRLLFENVIVDLFDSIVVAAGHGGVSVSRGRDCYLRLLFQLFEHVIVAAEHGGDYYVI